MIAQSGDALADVAIEVERVAGSQAAELVRAIRALTRAIKGEQPASSSAYEAQVARALDTPSCYVFLAVAAGTPVGYVSAYRFPRLDEVSDQVYIFDIEVAPVARRRGVGRRLMDSLLTTCWMEG